MVDSVGSLSSYFTDLIYNLMEIERKPLDLLIDNRDTLNIQRAVYSDLRTNIQSLSDSLKPLISSSPFYDLNPSRSTTVTPNLTDYSVLTATASSNAVVGDYDIDVIQLATAQRRASAAQSSISSVLNLNGSFYLGGNGTNSASIDGAPGGKVSSVSVNSDIDSNIHELDTGTYTIETRIENEILQFRMKDADDNYVQLGSSLSTDWQDVEIGTSYDTQRGMVINFADMGESSTTTVSYTAMGREIDVTETDSLVDIANNINDCCQPENTSVGATIVGNQLILTSQNTGTGHRMIYTAGLVTMLGFESDLNAVSADLQEPQDAKFTVNDLPGPETPFVRDSNSNITDVIHGITLNLAPDAAGKSAVLSISNDSSSSISTIEAFVSEFNTLLSYIEEKTAITKVGESYTRGALADNTIFSDLRSNLFSDLMQSASSGYYTRINDIGISIDDSLRLSITDSDALKEALESNLDDVNMLLDEVLGDVNNEIDRFLGSNGYLTLAVSNFDDQLTNMGEDINEMTARLDEREASLTNQYAEMQAQLQMLSYSQQMWSSI